MVNLCRRNLLKKGVLGTVALAAGLAFAKEAAAGVVFRSSGREYRIEDLVPIGTILAHGKATAPYGFVICNGAEVSRTAIYDKLFAVIGTSFGVGNGSTTFNLPNLVEKFPRGNTSVGGTGGATCHTHNSTAAGDHGHSISACQHIVEETICIHEASCDQDSNRFFWVTQACNFCKVHSHTIGECGSHNHTITACSHIPPYQDVVWMIKY